MKLSVYILICIITGLFLASCGENQNAIPDNSSQPETQDENNNIPLTGEDANEQSNQEFIENEIQDLEGLFDS